MWHGEIKKNLFDLSCTWDIFMGMCSGASQDDEMTIPKIFRWENF